MEIHPVSIPLRESQKKKSRMLLMQQEALFWKCTMGTQVMAVFHLLNVCPVLVGFVDDNVKSVPCVFVCDDGTLVTNAHVVTYKQMEEYYEFDTNQYNLFVSSLN